MLQRTGERPPAGDRVPARAGGGRLCLAWLAGLAALAGLLALPSAAPAAFHLMKIREVHTGGASGGSYVVLQMYSGGQDFVAGHEIDVYASDGAKAHTFSFAEKVPSGADQATILVAGSGYATAFPAGPAPDASDAGLDIPAVGGAVCFENIDCVAWGNFTGDESLPGAGAGNAVSPGGVTAGKALHRSIAASCSTRLENGDDSNDSATDLSEQEPSPRSNDSEIIEEACSGPNATIDEKPADPTNEVNAAFTYESPSGSASFDCWLDGDPFEGCEASGIEYTGLTEGDHIFRVRASDGTGPGLTANYSWTIDLTPPETTIDDAPEDETSGASVSFHFHADESPVAFECSVIEGEGVDSFSGCESPHETEGLEDGPYTFKVRATDAAGNQGPAAEHAWTVDNSAADTTPPQTTITSTPPDPSESSSASFTYGANEAPVSFECRLDGSAFAPCESTGITYEGLADGSHTFEVIAEDEAGNVSEPARYTFDVVLPEEAPSSSTSSSPPSPPPPLLAPLPLPPLPGTLVAGRAVPVKGSVALLSARCRGRPGARCVGTLRLVDHVRRNAGASRRRARKVVVGRTRYGLPAGNRRVVRVRLSGKGRRLLRRAGRRGLIVKLLGPGVRNRAVKLRPARRAKRRGGAATSAQGPTIEATGDGYGGFIWSPPTADVNAGGAVTFKSGSPTVPHGVTWKGGPESPSCSGVPIDEGKTSWSGSCAFAQEGTYAFVCTVHPSEMTGAITVRSGGAGTTNPPPPPPPAPPPAQSSPSEPVARGLKVARAQRGRSVRGSIVISRPSSGARLKIDLLARRAKLFRAKHRGRVRVGRLVRSGLQAGRVSFRVHLKRFARRALRRQRRLQRHRRLPLTVRVIVTSPQRGALKLTRKVVLRV